MDAPKPGPAGPDVDALRETVDELFETLSDGEVTDDAVAALDNAHDALARALDELGDR